MKKLFVLLFLALGIIPALAQDLPDVTDLPAGDWTQISLPEQYKCLYDTPYSFFVRPASVPTQKLMIYFEGGGACWDGLTCALKGQFASEFEVNAGDMSTATTGFFDFSNPDNPVKDYNTVFVPYCSGDIHTGNTEVTFDVPETAGVDEKQITVEFKGFDNASAVLDWVYNNYTAPEKVFVTGCSAGGYGAVFHSASVMNNYQDTPVILLADASTGVTPKNWEGIATWNAINNLPDFIPSLANISGDKYSTTYHVQQMAKFFPNDTFAEYNTFLDQTQVGFYGFMTGRPVDLSNFATVGGEWAKELMENLATLDVTAPNFASYTAGGTLHCITNRPEAYTYTVQGVPFMGWVQNLLDQNVSKSPTCDVSNGECLKPPAGQ